MGDKVENGLVQETAAVLKGKGQKKLSSMSVEALRALVENLGASCTEELSKEELVNVLLKQKRKHGRQAKQKAEEAPKAPWAPKAHEAKGAETADVAEEPNAPLLRARYRLRICSFNAMKLRLERDGLQKGWEALIGEFCQMDVLALSEVRAGALFQHRVLELLNRLCASGTEWKLVVSDPSGPGALEMHAVFYRSQICVLRMQTLKSVGGTPLDHAPFSVLLADGRPGGGCVVVTSVHLPPASRSRQRDLQIKHVVSAYRQESAVRLNTPFTAKGARDAETSFVAHVIAGDWNTAVGAPLYAVDKFDFEAVFGVNTCTTAGNRAFDNFLLSKETRNNYTVSARVMELEVPQNSHRGVIGVSDHSPIVLELERSTRS